MKKIIVTVLAVATFAACKEKSEEVKIDETKIENPADSIVAQDTVAKAEAVEPAAAPETVATTPETKPAAADAKMDVSAYKPFGAKFKAGKVLSKEEMLKTYKGMKAGDTVAVQFQSKINDVCKKKGCWMSLELPDKKESFVRFKDYGFFVPLNADGSQAIINGKAYIDVVSVAELQHYAKDGGKSDEEIAKITEPKITYAFQADGVLIK
jgi:hypothetical protein